MRLTLKELLAQTVQQMKVMANKIDQLGGEATEDLEKMKTELDKLEDHVAEAVEELGPLVENLTRITGNVAAMTDAMVAGGAFARSLLPTREEGEELQAWLKNYLDTARLQHIAGADKLRQEASVLFGRVVAKLPTRQRDVEARRDTQPDCN